MTFIEYFLFLDASILSTFLLFNSNNSNNSNDDEWDPLLETSFE